MNTLTPRPVMSPPVQITRDLVESLIGTGGYVHPLFVDTDSRETATSAHPLPGQGVLLLMGGLAERSGAIDDAIALLEIENVRFRRMVTAGDTLRVRVEPLESRTTESGRSLQTYLWTALVDDLIVVEARVLMLMTPAATAQGNG